MNRKQMLIAGMAMLLTGIVNAQPYNRYATFQAALSNVDNYDTGIAAVATYGIRIPELHKNFAMETDLHVTIIDPENQFNNEVSYYNFGVYGVYAHPLSQKFHFRGKLGVLYQSIEASGVSDEDIELGFGFGFTAEMGSDKRFIAEYTKIDSNVNHISVGLQFKM